MGYKDQRYRDPFSAPFHIGKTADQDVEEYRRRSPAWNAGKLQTPLLIRPGPKEIKQCKEECNAAGFSLRTIERAAHQLKLRMIRESGEGKNIYLWELQ